VSVKEVEVYVTPDALGRATILQDEEGHYCIWLLRVGEPLHVSPEPGTYRSLDDARACLRSLPGFSSASRVISTTPNSSRDPLLSLLREVVDLMKAHNERRWVFRLEGDLERLREGDTGAIEHLLSVYGGMGSFNDLYLCEQNGHKISLGETAPVNERLRGLASRINAAQ
jgi:hypothetical protein